MESAIEISSGSSSEYTSSDDEVPEPINQDIRTRRDPPWLAARMIYPRNTSSTVNSPAKIGDSSSEYTSSDDEVPEPVNQEIRTRRDPPWLAARMIYPRKTSSTVNSPAKIGDTNHVSRDGAKSSTTSTPGDYKQTPMSGSIVNPESATTSRPGDSKKFPGNVSIVNPESATTSRPGDSKQLPGNGSIVYPESSTTSRPGDSKQFSGTGSIVNPESSTTSRPGDSKQFSRTGSIVNLRSSSFSQPGDSQQFTGSGIVGNLGSSNVSAGDDQKLSSQQAFKRTLPPSFNVPSISSRSANSISTGNGSRNRSHVSRGGATSSTSSRPGDSDQFTGRGNIVHSGSSNVSGRNFEKLVSQQALLFQEARKRTLPPSFNVPPVPSRSGSSISNQTRFGSDYSRPAVSAVGNHVAHAEIGIHRGINGVRILPPSMMHGTSATPLHHASSSDSVHRIAVGGDRNSENDERLIYQAALQDLNQPKNEADLNPGSLSVNLMRHQKIALAWMFQKENNTVHCKGGILADDQGLGKTISTIALILKQKNCESQLKSKDSSFQEAEPLDLDADDDENGSLDRMNAINKEVVSSSRTFNRKRPTAGTLIVCPASVVRQWARELDEKVSDQSRLSVLVYHGGNRTRDPVELSSYDVVVTTYAIVTNEVPKEPLGDEDENDEKKSGKRKFAGADSKKNKKRGNPDCGTLARVVWSRVVLDEAQMIKNHRTQVARACCTLKAKRRWCLSGTPIQNTIDDLYSYFRFLRYDPYADYKSFYNSIKLPISRNSRDGYKKLQAVLRAIMLRRTKGTLLDGQPIIDLPPKIVNLSKVDFSVEERSFYKKLEADSQSQFKAYAAAGTLSQNYANILLMLLRLRQACAHPRLVKGFTADPVGKVSEQAVKRLPRELQISLLNRLKSSSAICCDCTDPPENPVVSLCGHVFCYQCVTEYLAGDENMCPARKCREQLRRDVVFSESTLRNCITDDLSSSSSHDIGVDESVFQKSEFTSTKVKAVLNILQSLSKQGSPYSAQSDEGDDVTVVKPMSRHSASPRQGPIKTIVFSQWTGMLDVVEMCFLENAIEFRRLDGTMSLGARDRAIKEFSNDPDVKVMLMSLKAGNLGLNMVAACHVIMLDLWWNPTTEDQAIDRAHRIGQTRPVTVTRITIKDTIEDKILNLQEDKRKMVASAFGEDNSGSSSKLTVDDLKYLFSCR